MTNQIMSLNENKRKAMLMLIEGATPVQVAKEIGVSHQRVYQWLKNREYRNQIMKATDQATFLGLARLKNNFNKAVDVMIESLQSDNESIRYKAARDYIATIMDSRARELENMELREHIDQLYKAIRKVDPEMKHKILDNYGKDDSEIDIMAMEETEEAESNDSQD